MENTPKRSRGRPPVAEEDKLEQRSIRLGRKQWAKIDAGGLPWLRALIDKAKTPTKPPPDDLDLS